MRRLPGHHIGAVAAALVALTLAVGPVLANPGDLDPAFSQDGIRQFSFSSGGDDEASDLTLGPGDKPVVVGSANGDMMVARLRANGSSDPDFSGDGRQQVDFGSFEVAFGVAMQGSKVLLAGIQKRRGAVARLKQNGARDTSFSGDGRATLAIAGRENITLLAVADGGDGRVVVVGSADNGDDDRVAIVVRYTAAGALDRAFSGDGVRIIDIPGGQARDLHVLASGLGFVEFRGQISIP
ncbi:MAG: hypothetical protein LH650_16765 [Chloroflexi bacterium]|nr:hypothetical protein [Chloroflexota bacterium]